VARLLGEFAAWFVAHAVITTAVFQLDVDVLHPIAIAWLAWCVGVLGLMTLRVVALPAKLATHLFIGACVDAGLFTLLPGRTLGDLLWKHGLGLIA